MIKSISPHIEVINTSPISYISSGGEFTGTVRFNASNQTMEVFDGISWIENIPESFEVGLSHETEELLDWAREKRADELAVNELATRSEAVRIALENLKTAEDQLTVTAYIARTHE